MVFLLKLFITLLSPKISLIYAFFYDDQQILFFVANIDVFKDTSIDEDEHEKEF